MAEHPERGRGFRRRRPLRAIPMRVVLPNLMTVLAVCSGLSGVRMAFEGRFEMAVFLVLVAAVLDALDGRVARMLKGTSEFGAQMDSLADIVNFGVAPALVLYAYVLERADAVGWIAALLYAIACGLRLARFNVMLVDPDRPAWKSDYFVGVPAPAGAILVMMPLYLGFLGVPRNELFVGLACAFAVAMALLMVSQLPVYSGKVTGARVRRDLVMPLILAVVLFVALLFSFPWYTLTAGTVLYLVCLPLSQRNYNRREAAEAVKAVEREGEIAPPA